VTKERSSGVLTRQVDLRHTLGRANVVTILASVVAWWPIVADGEVRLDAIGSTGILERGTRRRGTSHSGCGLPDDLAEVAPLLEVGHVRVGLTIPLEQRHLVVIEDVGDHRSDVAGWSTSADVLTITSTVDGNVVLIDAGVRKHLGTGSESVGPGQGIGRVVCAMVVVLVQHLVDVVA